MIIGADLGARFNSKVRVGPSSRPRELGPGEPGLGKLGVVESNELAGLLSFTMILLYCAVTPLEADSSSNLLGLVKLCRRFFWQVAILKQSRAKRKFLELFYISWLYH